MIASVRNLHTECYLAPRKVLGRSDRACADEQNRFVQVWERVGLFLTMTSLVRMTTDEAGPRLVAHDALSWWLCQVMALMFAQSTKYMQAGTWCCNQSGACTGVR